MPHLTQCPGIPNMSVDIGLRATDPELTCGGLRRRATECGILKTIFTEVVFILYSPWPPVKLTPSWLPPAVDMITKRWTVGGINPASLAPVSSDVDKLVPHTTSVFIRHSEEVVLVKYRADIISKVDSIRREITSGSPVSGDFPD